MSSSADQKHAFGWPGIPPRWTSSAKSGVGTSLNPSSRVWFTLSHGIINEVYYPRIDQACIRDLGLIVTDGQDFISEEKRHTQSKVSYMAPGVPAYRLINTCNQGRYRTEKEIVSDPLRDVVLQRIRFEPLAGKLGDYHLYVLLAPYLANHGSGNSAWVDNYKRTPMLFAQRQDNSLALVCSAPWLNRSAGFVGTSDGWQVRGDVRVLRHRQLYYRVYGVSHGGLAEDAGLELLLYYLLDDLLVHWVVLAESRDGKSRRQEHQHQKGGIGYPGYMRPDLLKICNIPKHLALLDLFSGIPQQEAVSAAPT